jgi:tetratricopeptide (TPR) repeat protein
MDLAKLQRIEWAVMIAAIGVRLAAWFSMASTRYAAHPLVDAYTYWDQARRMVAGKPVFTDGFYQPPGYPVVLSALQWVAGTDSPAVPRALQLALGVLTTWMLIRVGRALGERVSAPWAGAAAGLLYSLYPTTLLFELDLLTPALTSACAVGALALLVGGLSLRRCAGAGLLLGLAATAHPTYLLAAAAALIWTWWADRSRMMPALMLAAGLGVALGPIAGVNLVKFKTLSLTSSNSGINFYMGNNTRWRETSFLRPGLKFRRLALQAEPHKRNGQARDDYWMDRALSGIAEAPVAWGGALLTKAHWSIHSTEIPRNEDYRCRTQAGPMAWMGWLPVRYGWVFVLGLAGGAVLWPRAAQAKKSKHLPPDRAPGRLVIGMWLAMHLPVVLFIVSDRYRLATWPFLALAAPLGAAWLWRQRRRPRPVWLLLAAAAVLPWLPIDTRTAMRPGWCAHVAANLALMDGQPEEAERGYEQALALDPHDIDARNWLARTLARRGEVDAAADHVEAILAVFPTHFPTLKLQASLRRKQGRLSEAADLLLRAYRVPGKRSRTGKLAVAALRAAGRGEEARDLVLADPMLGP